MKEGFIAIIPAKGFSDALKQKNLQDWGGAPLFWESVRYARAEGVFPVVVTRDPLIHSYAESHGCDVVVEGKGEGMIQCIQEAMKHYPVSRYVLLQPTSPLRQPGLLSRILKIPRSCVFTAERVKVVGILDGEGTVFQGPRESASRFLWRFDGNMLTGTRDLVNQGILLPDDAHPVEQRLPYTLQIDYLEDLNIMRKIYESMYYWK